MNNYENTKNKIRYNFNSLTELNNKYKELKKGKENSFSVNYIKNQNIYILEEEYDFLNNNDHYIFNIFLNEFPSQYIPFIKVMTILSTNTGYESEEIICSTYHREGDIDKLYGNIYFDGGQRTLIKSQFIEEENKTKNFITGYVWASLEQVDFDGDSYFFNPLQIYGKIYLQIVNPRNYYELR